MLAIAPSGLRPLRTKGKPCTISIMDAVRIEEKLDAVRDTLVQLQVSTATANEAHRGAVGLLDGQGSRLADHERRLRKLEKHQVKLVAYASIVAALVTAAAAALWRKLLGDT